MLQEERLQTELHFRKARQQFDAELKTAKCPCAQEAGILTVLAIEEARFPVEPSCASMSLLGVGQGTLSVLGTQLSRHRQATQLSRGNREASRGREPLAGKQEPLGAQRCRVSNSSQQTHLAAQSLCESRLDLDRKRLRKGHVQ